MRQNTSDHGPDKYRKMSMAWTRHPHWKTVKIMETTSILISVRFLSLPNRSNQTIPARKGKSAAIIKIANVIEMILKVSLTFMMEKKSLLVVFIMLNSTFNSVGEKQFGFAISFSSWSTETKLRNCN